MADDAKITRGQLYLPLLEAIQDAGGSIRPKDVYDALASKVGLSAEERHRRITLGKKQLGLFERSARWTRQTGVLRGDIDGRTRGQWVLTDAGAGRLANATPGLCVTIYETGLGQALWATMEAALGVVSDDSVDLVFCSPPYGACAKKGYSNGNLDESDWVSFMFDAIMGLEPKLTAMGSMILNVAELYDPTLPIKGEHVSRLRIRLADETRFRVLDSLMWLNSSRLPTPVSWVSQRRIRLKPGLEHLLWISTNPFAKADNRQILQPYGDWMRKRIAGQTSNARTGRQHGGNYISERGFSRDNGGSIASNLIVAGASGGNRSYYAGARADGLPIHPAMMPIKVAEKCIAFTTSVGDLVFDPFAGSGTTAEAAERLGRRWLTCDASLAYGVGSRHRFPERRENGALIDDALRTCGRQGRPTCP